MLNPLFKLTALLGVIGAGAMVVIQAQKHLTQPEAAAAGEQFVPVDQAVQRTPPAVQSPLASAATAASPTPLELPPAQNEPGEPATPGETTGNSESPTPTAPASDAFASLMSAPPQSAAPQNAPVELAQNVEPAAFPAGDSSSGPEVVPASFLQEEPAAGRETAPIETASADALPPGQTEPAPAVENAADLEPTALEPTDLTALPDPDGAPLKKLSSDLHAPVLLTPPEADPAFAESSLPTPAPAAASLFRSPDADSREETVSTTPSDREPVLLAQAVLPPGERDRTRPPPSTTPGESADPFGPLPGGQSEPPPFLPNTPAAAPPAGGAESLVLPPPIAGTEPSDPFLPTPNDLLPPANSPAAAAGAPTPRSRVAAPSAPPVSEEPLFLPDSSLPSAPPPTAAAPPAGDAGFPDLFLPQNSEAAGPSPAQNSAGGADVLPPNPTEIPPPQFDSPPANAPAASADPFPTMRSREAPTRQPISSGADAYSDVLPAANSYPLPTASSPTGADFLPNSAAPPVESSPFYNSEPGMAPNPAISAAPSMSAAPPSAPPRSRDAAPTGDPAFFGGANSNPGGYPTNTPPSNASPPVAGYPNFAPEPIADPAPSRSSIPPAGAAPTPAGFPNFTPDPIPNAIGSSLPPDNSPAASGAYPNFSPPPATTSLPGGSSIPGRSSIPPGGTFPNGSLQPTPAAPPPVNTTLQTFIPAEPASLPPSGLTPALNRESLPPFPSSAPTPLSAAPTPINGMSTPTPMPMQNPVMSGSGTLEGLASVGLQQPELQIEKDAPPRAVLNQPLVYNIRVRNVGRTPAHQVIVEDSVPKGSTLVGTNPGATQNPQDQHLTWELGSLDPGAERVIRVQIVPTEPGEIGSVATVRFLGRIASKTVITAPKMKLELTGPNETAVGDTPVYRYRITNTGDADASHVVIQCTIPNLFQHPSGSELENDLGALRAGESRTIDLTVSAVKAGRDTNSAVILVDGREQDRASTDIVVLASRLSLERTGPERRFVNRPANYATQVTNQSTQPLTNVTIVEQLPVGMELAAVPEHGRYDSARRMIVWTLPQLAPQETKQFRSALVTADPGTYASSIKVWDAAGNRAEAASQLQVAGFSSLKVDVAQTTQGGGEVAVGEQVALRMTVANRGSASASDVITEFEIPPELEFVAAKPDRYTLDAEGRKVRFDAIPTLDVNGEQVIDIVCVAKTPGTPRIAASLWSKEQNAIRQEEAVVVFREEP